jgi:aspartate/methionine/tyrosine aminotransferase
MSAGSRIGSAAAVPKNHQVRVAAFHGRVRKASTCSSRAPQTAADLALADPEPEALDQLIDAPGRDPQTV